MAVSDYSTSPGDNTSISGLTVSDATVPDTLDNIIRQQMADVKAFYDESARLGATNVFSGTVDLTSATVNFAVSQVPSAAIADDAVTLAKIADAALSGSDATLMTGTAGATDSVAKFNADGDVVSGFTVGTAANELVQLDGSGALPAVDGSALTGLNPDTGPAAFVQFDGRGGITINASKNVSSVTYLGTGTYQINFTSALASSNFVTVASCNFVGTDGYAGTANNRTTSYVLVRTYEAGNLTDQDDINVVVFI